MINFAGKTVLITGAGRKKGLGEGIAQKFATLGANVIIADIGKAAGITFPAHGVATTQEMAELTAELSKLGAGKMRSHICDVRDEAQVVELVAYVVAECDGIDILINNAGIGYLMSPITQTPIDQWNAVLDVNLTGTFLMTKHVGRQMITRNRGGRIINIASQAAKSGFPHAAAYVSSKHALVGFTRTASIEFGPHQITVNAVCPNHVTTGLGAWQNQYFSELLNLSEEEYMEAMKSRIPLGRTGRPSDIANACAFLASDEAAYITGEPMNVSGGEETH